MEWSGEGPKQKEIKKRTKRDLNELIYCKNPFLADMWSGPRPDLRGRRVLRGATGFSRALVASADEAWAIRVSLAIRVGARQEGELDCEGERVRS